MPYQQPSVETRAAKQQHQYYSPVSRMATTADDKKLKNIESCMNKQYKELKKLILEEHSKLAMKLDKIESDFRQRFEEVTRTVADLSQRVQQLESTSEPSASISPEISQLAQRIDDLEREKISADAIIRGIPRKENENLHDLFAKLCHSVDCSPTPTLQNIFRTRTKDASVDTAIVVKFHSATDKNLLLKSVHRRWRTNKNRTLCLHDVGLPSDSRIYVNESLTSCNHLILRKALLLKRRRVLSSVFTRGGRVYVRARPAEETLLINSLKSLNSIADNTTMSNGDDRGES